MVSGFLATAKLKRQESGHPYPSRAVRFPKQLIVFEFPNIYIGSDFGFIRP